MRLILWFVAAMGGVSRAIVMGALIDADVQI